MDWNDCYWLQIPARLCRTSHEVRGLKYLCRSLSKSDPYVAPHTRCVDWNKRVKRKARRKKVAPHTRCVDWNIQGGKDTIKPMSRTSHEVRGLKSCSCSSSRSRLMPCRTSHEVRGLKCQIKHGRGKCRRSHLTRGAWIEIPLRFLQMSRFYVAPHTRCVDWNTIHKFPLYHSACRTSHEVRGLKFDKSPGGIKLLRSHLTRGAWIEIYLAGHWRRSRWVAPHTRCVDWNTIVRSANQPYGSRTSHEVRGLK